MPATIGQLRRRMRFEYREPVADDGYGNREGEWTPLKTMWARVAPMRGNETIIAERRSGVQPVMITVRYDRFSTQVTTDYRAVDEQSGETFNIRSGANFDEHKKYIDFIADAGVPV